MQMSQVTAFLNAINVSELIPMSLSTYTFILYYFNLYTFVDVCSCQKEWQQDCNVLQIHKNDCFSKVTPGELEKCSCNVEHSLPCILFFFR